MMKEKTGYQIAEERIEEAARTKADTLNLSNLGLKSLPPKIVQLTKLTWLHLEDNQLTSLPSEITQLANLIVLSFIRNQLTSLPPEIGKLTKLAGLNLGNNKLTSLPPEIGQLANLTSLSLVNNQLISLPPEIGLLANMTSLKLNYNQLISLPPEIGELNKLTSLEINNNKLASLPPEILSLNALKTMDLRDNLLDVPPEILEKIEEPQIILDYLDQIWQSKRKPLSETKMLVVGQGSVGKTSLIRRIINNVFSPSEHKTDGIAIDRWQVANMQLGGDQPESLRVNIWDFGGQEIMHATHQFFLTRRSLYLLVLDSRLTQEENRVEYWLKIIQSFGGKSPVLIIGNKVDQHPLDIDRTGLKNKYPDIIGILETSAATGVGLEELKTAIAQQVNSLPHVRDALPETWFNIKKQLEELGHNQNYISQEKYADICVAGEIRDAANQRTLIGFLHDLGIVLYFQDDPQLESLGILNPQWVTNGVYKILNTRDILDNKGVMTLSMLNDILDFPEYPRDKRLFIVEMMQKFELCYDIDHDKFLIPDLLPKDEPYTGEWKDALAFQYHYNVLPSSIISRFIVRQNAYIYKTVWRSGVVLQKESNTALVKADMEDHKIYIWVNGAENTRRDFLSVIRAEFDSIHKTIIKIEATKKVPHPEYPRLILDYNELIQFERDKIEEFPRSVEEFPRLMFGKTVMVNVRQLLNGVGVESNKFLSSNFQPSTPAAVLEPPLLVKIARWIFVQFPKAVGRFPLDLFGHGKDAAEVTLMVIGYSIIIFAILLQLKIIDFKFLWDWFTDWWRFFYPVKP